MTDRANLETPAGIKLAAAAGLWIERPHLLERLAGSSSASLSVIVAPSGYGKTTLLSQWDAADERPFVWISLDGRHDDPALLIGAIAASLDRLEPLGDRVFAPLMAPRPNLWNVVVPRLCDALSAGRKPFVLVLDDLHRTQDREALEPLATIAEHMPEGSRLAIASRSDPQVPLGRLRTQRGVIEIGAAELAMSRAEAGGLLGHVAPELGEADIDLLFESTEGWPAGLYLGALALERHEDSAGAIERLRGDDRFIADYLREEFLSSVSKDELEFLIGSSVLGSLSGGVCDEVLDREGSHSVLRHLSQSNMLLVPLDRRGQEYRLHALLREMLAAELHNSDPELERRLNRRAGAWFAAAGDVDRAVPHLLAAGDVDRSAALIWGAVADYISTGREATIRGWLARISDEKISASPPLCLARATVHLSDGNGVEVGRWIGKALAALEGWPATDAEALALEARVVRASGAAVDGVAQVGRDLEGVHDLLAEDSPWRSLCRFIEGVAVGLQGDRDRARKLLEDGIRKAAATAPHIESLCLAQLSLMAAIEADQEQALARAEQALAVVELHGLVDYPTTALIFGVVALARARDGRVDDATRAQAVAVRLGKQLNGISDWYEIELRVLLARTALLLDDVPAARASLAAAGRYVARDPDAVLMKDWVAASWEDAETARAVSGRWPLTPAEVRLLHHLPTHLTFREIADMSFVSTNTVKTQARSIYRKLGVTSRAEAVGLAREAGLLDGAGPAARE